ncbi:MAG: chromosome segregation protein SMC, partial [Gemmatimonadota bacterium]|nr:chromosome segregation protein SMC [Gemmatimonadota bacterium]
LSKLELQGFKSFADETSLVFEQGVTAIVGPNGCGKSNVSDAVRWVLGEQRARTLRGAKMEEVIFQGSTARRPVNIAEVSLHFENDDGALPVPYKEVVITRRLSRSGESEYLLNRTPCRLRDIHDLVRGTGLGADSGVVIESRMIDALLSDRPDERRELFEEAAGVSMYRDRRRTTERRLEETAVDLARLDDLIGEVQTQVRSLARQRKKAERHTELTNRRFHVELTLATREMEAWHEELARLEGRVTSLRAEGPTVEQRVRDAEQRREDTHGARAAAEGHRAELARLVTAQQQDVMRLQSEMAVAEERQRNAVARRERAESERQQGEAMGQQLVTDREHAVAELARLNAELASASEQLAARVQAEELARRTVADARAAFDESERKAMELREQARRLELDREGAAREQEEISQRIATLAVEREQHSEALSLTRGEMVLAVRAVEEATAAATEAAEELAVARAAGDDARGQEGLARTELFRAEETTTSLQGKVSALEALERERVGLAPAAARLLRERERFVDGAVLGPLSDFISAGATSALAVERFLGATVHAVLVRDRATADAVRAWHVATNPGPLLLLPVDAAPAGDADITGLSGSIDAAAPARDWVRALLGRVESLDDGAAFVDARGAVWLPGAVTGPGPLRRRAELFALRAELESSDAARREALTSADEARAMREEADRAVALATDASAEGQQIVRRAAEQRDAVDRAVKRIEREIASVDQLSEKSAARGSELTERVAALDARTRAGESEIVAQTELVSAARARLDDADRVQESAREERTRWQVEQAQGQARMQVAADREQRLTSDVSTAAARLESLLKELSEIEHSDAELAHRMAEWQLDLEGRQGTLHDGETRLAAAERHVLETDGHFDEAERALDDARRASATLAEDLHHAELRLAELSGHRTAIRGRLEAQWRKPLEELMAALVPVEVDEETLRDEANTLRDQLEAIGPVNPLAIEEHDEEAKRLDFLTAQRADLANAKTSLQQAIREIDVTARELFMATFTQVRENFRQIFMTLFGGGECDLRLENPELPLDCDIEIHASPRGKRTQRIHLLSSGERALVALSLLFGIFLTKPSPFCLLDEVDAPLDDQNVGRFVRMLNQFKTKTQFIVITHNPRTTTEAADAVYGVTMQEPGVSSFVSVRMRGAAVEDADSENRADRGAEAVVSAV